MTWPMVAKYAMRTTQPREEPHGTHHRLYEYTVNTEFGIAAAQGETGLLFFTFDGRWMRLAR